MPSRPSPRSIPRPVDTVIRPGTVFRLVTWFATAPSYWLAIICNLYQPQPRNARMAPVRRYRAPLRCCAGVNLVRGAISNPFPPSRSLASASQGRVLHCSGLPMPRQQTTPTAKATHTPRSVARRNASRASLVAAHRIVHPQLARPPPIDVSSLDTPRAAGDHLLIKRAKQPTNQPRQESRLADRPAFFPR
jgi:hypothetical protein